MKDTKTKQPSLRGINKIVRALDRVVPQAKHVEHRFYDSVNMYNIHVESRNQCNTPMCHGGWFAYSVNLDHSRKKCPNYKSGATLMAKELGFKRINQLLEWADENPKMWGNKNGCNMFSSMAAFESKNKKPTHKLENIILHWKGVANRIRKSRTKK